MSTVPNTTRRSSDRSPLFDAALALDVWITAGSTPGAVYEQYADATGHAPPLRENAMIFWQSRNRYMSSEIALGVAQHYEQLKLPVGVIVIDYKNEHQDGDFAPNPACFPSVKTLSEGIRSSINATTMFSFWPVSSQSHIRKSSPELEQ